MTLTCVWAIRSALLLSSQVTTHSDMLSGFPLLLKVPTVQDATVVVSLDSDGSEEAPGGQLQR